MATSGQRFSHRRDFPDDERWQLVQRIAASPAFQKTVRLRDLLIYLAGQALSGSTHNLTEQKIGHAVLGKPADYSPMEDSSVRVHVRQLRLKLHEYFDLSGQAEPLTIEIPKGSYVPLFHPRLGNGEASQSFSGRPRPRLGFMSIFPWALTGALAVLCVVLLAGRHSHEAPVSSHSSAEDSLPPWPLSEVFDATHRTDIVTADANYGMLCIIRNHFGTLQDYLRPGFPQDFLPRSAGAAPSLLTGYIQGSLLTSFADVADATDLFRLAGGDQSHVCVLSARDLRLRDLETGNYIFLGSDTSNPWVSLYEPRLNFVEVAKKVIGGMFFVNRKPLPGEPQVYPGGDCTREGCIDYGTISLVRNQENSGNVLILQGLQQEGTEAAGNFLADPDKRRALYHALGFSQPPKKPVYFEAVIRTEAIGSAPRSVAIVATRLIQTTSNNHSLHNLAMDSAP
jgi:hypothetical protein